MEEKLKKALSVYEEMKEALHKRAVGYEVEETEFVASVNGKPGKIIRRKRHIPGDPKAMMQYLSLYGDDKT